MGCRHRPPGFLPDLLNLEAPHPSSAPVCLDDSEKGWRREVGDALRGQASPQHGEASRSRDRLPRTDEFREHAVELMHQPGLQCGARAAKTVVFSPASPQVHVRGGQELALGDNARSQQLRDLLRIHEVSFVSPHLPGLAHPERRERIDHVIPKRVLLQEGANRLPHVPGGLERKVHLTVFSAGSTRRAALHELVESRSGVRNLEAREALSTRIEHDHLVLTSRQIDAHEDIV